MTTNVLSLLPQTKMLACDSRWSYETERFFYYIDHSGYDKIAYTDKMVAIFAGNASVIEQLKKWIKSNLIGKMPDPNDTSIIAYNLVNQTYFARNHSFSYPSSEEPEALFSGSGSFDAIRSWKIHRSPIRSVQDACLTDLYTGGEVKFFDLISRQNNLQKEQLPISALFTLLSEEGFVIRKQTQSLIGEVAISMKEAVNDPEIVHDLHALKSGQASFNAPAPEAMIKWHEEEINNLETFFQNCK